MTTSPCTSCADLHTPCPCPAFLRWDITANPDPVEPECLTCVEVEWLLLAGEMWEQVAARLRIKPDSLERHLYRHQRTDLLPRRTA